jgi:PAS domain S-box-containing protein
MKAIPESKPSLGLPVEASEAALVFDSVFDLFGTIDQEGRVITLNGRIFERTNSDPNLLSGQILAQTVFWQSSENTSRLLSKVIDEALAGQPSKIVLDFRVSAEQKVPIELSLVPLPMAELGGPQIFVCGRLISERSDQISPLKKESEQLLSAAENAEIGLWFWDFAEGRIYSTPRCNELLGLPAYDPLTYDTILMAAHPDDREFVTSFLDAARVKGTRYEEEFRVVYADGTVEWLCVEGKSFLDEGGGPQRMMGVVRKITEQKLAADELAMVYDREKKARDEAEEANRAKDFFLAFVSHELRAPLNAILGWSKILLTKPVDEETHRNAIETIERSARVQTKLINDLVDSARVASGKLRLEYRPTDLHELVRVSCQAQKPAADARNITLDFTGDRKDLVVFGDINRLQQVFGNVISNAIKFTPDHGTVSVSVTANDSSAIVKVSDTGQGISSEALPTIFQQFRQGDQEKLRMSGGLGLGLSIAKILAERHGGSIQAESEGPGQGSVFTIMLPLADSSQPVPSAPRPETTATSRPLAGVNILIVEDDPDSREVLHLFLEQNGAVSSVATNARSAMKALTETTGRLPDVIISDIAMPEEDGYSLISKIRSLPVGAGGSIPAIALSAFATKESRQKAFDAGFQKYSTKPFEPDLLISEILDVLRIDEHSTVQ